MGVHGKLEMGKNLERTIADMPVGEIGYTIPWALWFDKNQMPYLDITCNVYDEPGGTVELRIRRTGPEISDYYINLEQSGLSYKWKKNKNTFDEECRNNPFFNGEDYVALSLDLRSEEEIKVSIGIANMGRMFLNKAKKLVPAK